MPGRQRQKNVDEIMGGLYPLQTYGWSGRQWGYSSDELINGKAPTSKPPMSITSQPPGAFAQSDDEWQRTFGASHDCVLSLLNGRFLEESSTSMTISSIYKDAMPHVQDHNLFIASDGVQQIDYIVSKETIEEARDVATTSSAGAESEMRGLGMRSPLMMVGWGKTIGLRPTDPEPTNDTNRRKNDESHKLARETWKHGAVDLRWDERRGMWAAWNDLIVDHEDKNLGTLVFSTNPDEICGFPFLKGKLQDVWWVRTTPDVGGDLADNAGQGDDFIQTGEICTHLGHKWFDSNRDNAAPLSSVFIVDETEDLEFSTCGDEVTGNGRIEILTTTFFHLNDNTHGPICFSPNPPEANELVGCMKFNGSEFVPTVVLDPCDALAGEFAILFGNDKSIVYDLNRLVDAHNDIELTGTKDIVNGKATVDGAPLAQAATTAIQTTMDTILGVVQNTADTLRDDTQGAFDQLIAELKICLEPFGCSVSDVLIGGVQIDQFTAPPVDGAILEGDVTGSVDVEIEVPLIHPPVDPVDPCEDGASPIVTP